MRYSKENFAQHAEANLVTFYWTPYFLGYYDYQSGDENLLSEALSDKALPIANANMLNGHVSEVGRATHL